MEYWCNISASRASNTTTQAQKQQNNRPIHRAFQDAIDFYNRRLHALLVLSMLFRVSSSRSIFSIAPACSFFVLFTCFGAGFGLFQLTDTSNSNLFTVDTFSVRPAFLSRFCFHQPISSILLLFSFLVFEMDICTDGYCVAFLLLFCCSKVFLHRWITSFRIKEL
jgi:hypothetical protein